MIELLKGYPDNVVAVSVHGEVTRKDYDTVLVPAVEKALQVHERSGSSTRPRPTSTVTPQTRRGRTSRSAWSISRAGNASP